MPTTTASGDSPGAVARQGLIRGRWSASASVDRWLNPPGLDEASLAVRTLTNLYNERPTWLAHAHTALDAAVFAAYGWPADLPAEEVLARLLVFILERPPA